MQAQVYELEKKISILQQEITNLKDNYARLKYIENEVNQIKHLVTKMEMIDNSIFDRLDLIAVSINKHKDNFYKHDEKEMEKYSSIDGRLNKIERILYMMIGAGLLFEILHKFNIINVGG